ncbi:hypothetical protein [Brevibacillus thermoruber]|jgi:hypothetical protein|uniref:hypothetical protein n=1 Tax=Brevibacillus thermoruber TaxID=33942 RepID=UPI00041DDD2E|nr:hypothetical protein [Brevibacillus thermoruber]
MNKRLTKSEFLVAYMIIITLACFVGGFFFGARYMKAAIEEQQAAAAEAQKQAQEQEKMLREQKLYSEQDFIRFHYAVYAPLLELKQAHFDKMADWSRMDKQQRTDSLNQLAETAKETIKQLEKPVPLATAPLLIQSQSIFRDGVRAYLDSMEQLLSDQNSNALGPDEIASRLTLSQNSWLKGQELVYQALAAWESSYVTKQPMPKAPPMTVSIAQWKQYPFHYRTYLAAAALTHHQKWTAYNPEDLTARLDMLVSSNEWQSLGIRDVDAAIRLLTATGAVHGGDFKQLQIKLYPAVKTPELPIFR